MLQFLRRYQRIFFFAITFFIVISFVFFGVSPSHTPRFADKIIGKSIAGKKIKHSEVQSLAFLLNSNNGDHLFIRGLGPHFSPNEILIKDFLEDGLAELLVEQYGDHLSADLESRLEKEKNFIPYVHPNASFIKAGDIWARFNPNLNQKLTQIKRNTDATSKTAFKERVTLFLQEKQFPCFVLWQVIKYQEQDYDWLKPDQNLLPQNLSLFHYQSIEDWFGPTFLQLVSQFIINAADLAESKGYQVSYDEALLDLQMQNENSFRQLISLGHSQISSSQELWQLKLNRLGLDKTVWVKLWQKVLLFRRLFDEIGNSVFLDPLIVEKFESYANEAIEVDNYQLPNALRFHHFDDVKKFEMYLHATANKAFDSKDPLEIPTSYSSLESIEESFPELVQQHYTLKVKELNRSHLKLKIGIREVWDWELEEGNFDELKSIFPVLAKAEIVDEQARFDLLENLDERTRVRIDEIARESILAKHLNWLDEAMDHANEKEISLNISSRVGDLPFKGSFDQEKKQQFMKLLNKASSSIDEEATFSFVFDDETFYRFKIVDKGESKEILSFETALQNKTLDKLLDKELQKHYYSLIDLNAKLFKSETGLRKSFDEVKDEVAEMLFAPLKEAIKKDYFSVNQNKATMLEAPGFYASHRFFAYMREKLNGLMQDSYLQDVASIGLGDQFHILKEEKRIGRGEHSQYDKAHVFSKEAGDYSSVFHPLDGDVSFIHIKNRIPLNDGNHAFLHEVKQELANDTKRCFMQSVLTTIKEKRAIHFDGLQELVETEDDVGDGG